MKKIEKLTQEQIDKMAEWRDKWTAIGLSTEPANRPEAERAIGMIYAAAGKAAPRIVWCDSPFSQGLTRFNVLNMGKNKIVRASVRDSVGDSVWDSVWDSVRDSVGASVWDSVRDSVGDSVWDSVWDSVGDSVWDSGYGQHDANWVAFYDYFRDVCGLTKQTEPLEGMILLAQHAGWFLPHEKICWVSERHNILHRDMEGRLHCETGPALAYPDTFSIWAWHGTRVPQRIIEEPETLTVKEALAEENVEVRRVMLERMGWSKVVEQSELRVIHRDTLHSRFPRMEQSAGVDNSDPAAMDYVEGVETAELMVSDNLKDFEDRPLKFVRLVCPSTGRVYIQRVAHDETRVYAAVAKSFKMTEEEYKTGSYIRQGDVLVKPLNDVPIQQSHS